MASKPASPATMSNSEFASASDPDKPAYNEASAACPRPGHFHHLRKEMATVIEQQQSIPSNSVLAILSAIALTIRNKGLDRTDFLASVSERLRLTAEQAPGLRLTPEDLVHLPMLEKSFRRFLTDEKLGLADPPEGSA